MERGINTGWKTGAVAKMERNLGNALQWNICLKHCNELPLRHVFDKLDGGLGTSGPESFKGEIGQAISGDIHLQAVVKFNQVSSTLKDIPKSVLKEMSRDYAILYRYTKAVISGYVHSDLISQKPRLLNHSRRRNTGSVTPHSLHTN